MWDKELNKLLDNYLPTDITQYTCRLNNIPIWIENYPYSYGHQYKSIGAAQNHRLPRRRTVSRLRRLLKKHKLFNLLKQS